MIWLPHRTPLLNAARRLPCLLAAAVRVLTVAMILGAVLTVAAGVVASVGTY